MPVDEGSLGVSAVYVFDQLAVEGLYEPVLSMRSRLTVLVLVHLQTIENTREADVTMVQPDDEEVAAEEDQDEFAGAGASMEYEKGVLGLAETHAALS